VCPDVGVAVAQGGAQRGLCQTVLGLAVLGLAVLGAAALGVRGEPDHGGTDVIDTGTSATLGPGAGDGFG
jgi:hypothetical protein